MNPELLATALSAESQAEGIFAALLAPLMGFCVDKWKLGNGMLIIALLLLVFSPLFLAKKVAK